MNQSQNQTFRHKIACLWHMRFFFVDESVGFESKLDKVSIRIERFECILNL